MKTIFSLRGKLAIFALLMGLAQAALAQNFSMTMAPNTVTLVAGQTSSFIISLAPLDGFTNKVTLSTSTLPSGVTASFGQNNVTLPAQVVLTLTAAAMPATGTFQLDITGVSGAITNTTASSVEVSFGLLQICTGNFVGRVTDTNGVPIAGALIQATYSFTYAVLTDSQGFYSISNVSLANNNNTPANYSFRATSNGYYFASSNAYAVCGTTNTVNFQLVKAEYGSVSGTLNIIGGGSAAGIAVGLSGQGQYSTISDGSGNYSFTNVALAYNNVSAAYSLASQPSGYFYSSTNLTVQANVNTVTNLNLLKICYGSVVGRVLRSDTLTPVTNLYVTFSSVSGVTDTNGNYNLTNISLAQNNTPITTYVGTGQPIGYNYGSSSLVTISNCGQQVTVPDILLTPLPATNYASGTGFVYDLQTMAPITNAYVSTSQGAATYSDSHGAYNLSNLLVGFGATTTNSYYVSAQASGYFPSSSNVQFIANQTSTQNLLLLRQQFGYVQGHIVDEVTLLPLANVFVSSPVAKYTDSNGYYLSGPIALGTTNGPTAIGYYTITNNYYQYSTNTTITAGNTNTVDIPLLKVCTGATIVGNVVDATTQKPLTNATVSVSYQNYESVSTDTNGNFILTNITVGNLNSPVQVTVSASAPGYNPQSHNVTIFCDASITTEFGAPQTAFGTIQGYVTNILTGVPLTNVFIGSQFGASTVTDTNGFYSLTNAPLGANGSPRTWTVTAIPDGFPQLTESTTVSSNNVSILNFGFGEQTHLVVSNTNSHSGTNVIFTVVLTNSSANALNVVLQDTLPSGVSFVSAVINPANTNFSTPGFTNGVITTTAPSFPSNDVVTLVITGLQTVSGTLVDIATVSSDTPDSDPSSHTAQATNTVSSSTADLAVTVNGPTTSVNLSTPFTYLITVQNIGPNNAPDVVLTNLLPTAFTLDSSSNSQGSVTQTSNPRSWDLGAISSGASAHVTVTAESATSGTFTNIATIALGSGVSSTTDPNPANNLAQTFTTVSSTVLTNVTVSPGPNTLDFQTGLFEQVIQFNNLSGTNVTHLIITISGLPSGVVVYNASGTTNGFPYVEYDQTIPTGGSVSFTIEYYNPVRTPFTPTATNFSSIALTGPPPTPPVISGTPVQLDAGFPLLNRNTGKYIVEFASSPGSTYVIQYTGDLTNWLTAVPAITASGSRVQWIDSGPPKTISSPAGTNRFYRVYQTK